MFLKVPLRWVVRCLALVGVLTLSSTRIGAQEQVTLRYAPKIASPAYPSVGPVVAVDASHHNFHRLDGRYAPLGALGTADGYRVQPFNAAFSQEALQGIDILVVANALPAPGSADAFTATEIAALTAWVRAGGSLLLIADHTPYGSAAAPLAAAFGVNMGQGYVVAAQDARATANIRYTRGALANHPIISGRTPQERVRAVTAFTGQSLSGPPEATSILIIPAGALEVTDQQDVAALGRGERVQSRPAGGRTQVLAMPFGKGRIVVAGEAAMFSAQRISFPDGGSIDAGLMIDDDRQFALNVLHWLSKLIG